MTDTPKRPTESMYPGELAELCSPVVEESHLGRGQTALRRADSVPPLRASWMPSREQLTGYLVALIVGEPLDEQLDLLEGEFRDTVARALADDPLAPIDLVHDHEPIHGWFGLSYASYLVLPRSILQSAPLHTQRLLVGLLQELNNLFGLEQLPVYRVTGMDDHGKFVRDPFAGYERGRRRILPREPADRPVTP